MMHYITREELRKLAKAAELIEPKPEDRADEVTTDLAMKFQKVLLLTYNQAKRIQDITPEHKHLVEVIVKFASTFVDYEEAEEPAVEEKAEGCGPVCICNRPLGDPHRDWCSAEDAT